MKSFKNLAAAQKYVAEYNQRLVNPRLREYAVVVAGPNDEILTCLLGFASKNELAILSH